MSVVMLPVRAIASIDGRAYEIAVQYSDDAIMQGLWTDLWDNMSRAGVALHTFDDTYQIGPHTHPIAKKYEVLKRLCDQADEYLDWNRYPLEFPEYPVEEDTWFHRNALDVLCGYYWMRDMFMMKHGAGCYYRTTGNLACRVGWFFCLKEMMVLEEFMQATEAWTEEMDRLENECRYDFKIVDEDKEIVDSLHGCDDLDHLLTPVNLSDPRMAPLIVNVREYLSLSRKKA